MNESYYAHHTAKAKAEADGKNWDRIGVAEQDTYINAEMAKAGYKSGAYMGAGARRWSKQ
jgi:hypothetical protein